MLSLTRIGQISAIIINSPVSYFSLHSPSATQLRTQAVRVVIDLNFGVGLSTGSFACEIHEFGQINEPPCVSVFSSIK